jgi:TMEM175 potassium channel family protein
VTSSRLEAFSDAVIAILMTIMVLELRAPDEATWHVLRHDLLGVFLAYILSFVFLGIYWNNHHHMLAVTERINGKILWANLHLLFWLSLFPFMTAWIGRTHAAELPTALYGAVLLLAALAYYVLKTAIVSEQGPDSRLATALGNDFKGKISPVLYAIAIPLAYVEPWISIGIYVLVALIWLVPDRRIESTYASSADIE